MRRRWKTVGASGGTVRKSRVAVANPGAKDGDVVGCTGAELGLLLQRAPGHTDAIIVKFLDQPLLARPVGTRAPQLQNGRVFFQASCPIRHALGLHLTCGRSILRTTAACAAHHSFLQCRCYSCAFVRLFPIVLITPQAPDAPKTDQARPSASTPPQDLPRVPSFARRPVYIAYDTLIRVVMLDFNSSL